MFDIRKFIENYDKLLAMHGSQRAVAEHLGQPRSSLQKYLREKDKYLYTTKSPEKPKNIPLPSSEEPTVLFFTSAQDKSAIHNNFLVNLQAYIEKYRGGSIHVSSFTYNKSLFEENRKEDQFQEYSPYIRPYLDNRRYQIGKNLIWCGEMNTLPTASKPLSSFEVYTQNCSGIFPHAKVQLASVPVLKGEPSKQIMTTGAITLPNYVQRRAGILAEFHHVIGGVIVEIDSKGNHFCRHIQAEADGSFYDLNYRVENGKVKKCQTVEAITWGDIHLEKVDEEIADVNWGFTSKNPESIIDYFKPRYQFLHDTTDFTYRNHHTIKDPHERYKLWYKATESITESFDEVYKFIKLVHRKYCETVVVPSNHDAAGNRYLKEVDWRTDPVNMMFNLQGNIAWLQATEREEQFSSLKWYLETEYPDIPATILQVDDKFPICHGIECGMHGHLGSNGSRGTPSQLTRSGPKTNTGHTHSPQIIDGAYVAGTSSKLDLGYNKGPSSWAHAHIITYYNGKRAILMIRDGKFKG